LRGIGLVVELGVDKFEDFLEGVHTCVGKDKVLHVEDNLLQCGSYLKEIAVVLPGGDTPLVGSSEFIVLRPNRKALPVEALLVYLRSPYVQTILKWCQDGSNHPRFDEKELLAIPIPAKIAKIQDHLAARVKDAIAARRESRRILDTAKRAVEMAIEAR
jgi:restriction endonuclease S subunit